MRTFRNLIVLLFVCFVAFSGCKKTEVPITSATKFRYSDSVFYLRNQAYTVLPVHTAQGSYSAFPDNLVIDKNTGAITIAVKGNDGQSQTGLRYKIKFQANTGETDSTYIVISGISYFDKFYFLSQNDSLIAPEYNGDSLANLPSGNYDLAHDDKFAINPANGQINANELLRRGFFNNQQNASWKQVTVKYQTDDGSSISNSLDIILYYYNTINEVPKNVSALMQAHQAMSLGANRSAIPSTTAPADNNLSSDLSLSKPRPPCLIIIGH